MNVSGSDQIIKESEQGRREPRKEKPVFRRQEFKLLIRILKVHCLFLLKPESNSVLSSKQRKVRVEVSAVIYKNSLNLVVPLESYQIAPTF